MADENGIEVVDTTIIPVAPDPDLMPIMGKPIIKLIWNEQAKTWSYAWDSEVIPNIGFVAAGCRSVLDDLEMKIRLHTETSYKVQLGRQFQEQVTAHQLAESLRQPQQPSYKPRR